MRLIEMTGLPRRGFFGSPGIERINTNVDMT